MSATRLKRGIYFIADSGVLPDDRLVPVTEAALRGGVVLVQLRAKGRERRDVARLGRDLLAVTRRAGVPLLINDLPDVAAQIRADGVHVGQEDVPVRDARALLGPGAIIGATTNTPEAVLRAQAEGADYVAVGAIFPSPTKPDAQGMSLPSARELSTLTDLPLCAIGGIREENIGELAELGPKLVCVVSAIALAADPEGAARRLGEAMAAWPLTRRR